MLCVAAGGGGREDGRATLLESIMSHIDRRLAPIDRHIARVDEIILPMVVNLSVTAHNPWTPSVLSGTRDPNFRQILTNALGHGRTAQCMVSGLMGNGEQVIAAHIIPSASNELVMSDLGLSVHDLNDVRNGLFLAVEIERAFDKLQISFVKSNPLSEALYFEGVGSHLFIK